MGKNDFETPLDAEGWGAHYNESMLERVVYLVKNDRLTSWSRKMIEMTQPGDRVLEIGCGSGETSLALAGRRATALDYSKSSVALARRASEVLGVSLDVRLVDATQKLPFPDESFDLAFQAGLLEHFQKEERIRLLDLWRPVCRTILCSMNSSLLAMAMCARAPWMRCTRCKLFCRKDIICARHWSDGLRKSRRQASWGRDICC